MKLYAITHHKLYGRIKIVGVRLEDGACLVREVYATKHSSLLNLLCFEFSDRNYPCGGFTCADVAEYNTILQDRGIEILPMPSVSVLVKDYMDGVSVNVVDGHPSPGTLSWIRKELGLEVRKSLPVSNEEAYQDIEGRKFEPWDGKLDPDWAEVPIRYK